MTRNIGYFEIVNRCFRLIPESLNHYYLQQMGIEPWVLRQDNACEKKLNQLALQVASCTNCTLHKTRSQTVFSRGNYEAKLMIIGEAPGFYEDQKGLPFVGKAGALLDQMLKSIGLSDQDVYIANVLKCRPPDNRDPAAEEIQACSNYLSQQVAIVEPHLILALGRYAGQFLSGSLSPLHQLRSGIHDYQDTPFIVTYHPAYLLRNPKDKKKAYSDLQRVKALLEKREKNCQ